MEPLRLSEIWIYPIKSLGGIRLKSSKVLGKGLPHDRRWMLIDEQGTFLTQRIHPSMALFKLTIDQTHLTIHYNNDSINVPISPVIDSPALSVTIWDDRVTAHEVDAAFSSWFTQRLGFPVKLVYFPENNPRPVDPRFKVNDENVSLADAYPFLLIGQSSLDDLNTRLAKPVPMNRFRPNFVFTGGKPYEEDSWRNFSIGESEFVGVKPCARCVLTTIDQATAEKSAEPLKTLASYRTKNNKVLFGQNLVTLQHSQINEGDLITVKSYQ